MKARGSLVSWAIRIYGGAMLVYPRPLRDRYGHEMRRTFADRCCRASSPISSCRRDAATSSSLVARAFQARDRRP